MPIQSHLKSPIRLSRNNKLKLILDNIIMAYSASIGNRNPQFLLRGKAKTYCQSHSSTNLNTVPPLLGQIPHFDYAGSHATIDSYQDGKVISWERDPTTYLVSATSFNGIHRPFCELCVGDLRFPLVDFFPCRCTNS
jgi:hypothetical protein